MTEFVYEGSIDGYLVDWYEKSASTTLETGRRPERLYREYIADATKNSTLSDFVYKETLRAVISEFNNIHYVDGDNELKKVKAMHATPERVIGKLNKEFNTILPVITVSLLQSANDDNKRRYDNIVVQNKVWNDDIQRAERIIGLADVPVRCTYSINLWAKYMEDLDQLTQNIRVKFNPSARIQTPFSDNIKCFLVSESSTGSATAADKEDRILRKTFNAELEMYIPSPKFKVTSTGKIEKLVGELWVS